MAIISVLKSVVRKYNFANTKFMDKKIGLNFVFKLALLSCMEKNVFFFFTKIL